ncbi:hypothetical protein LIPSTDRAFT_216856 [Lipomyces starkeyi NRRL Y-11557]|uniref:valine--tRNA ligase n=1 Tax=Lipomyces starkeyi NRRL Y-11557 TaxID=675824 RepID=A0A1E3QDV0_LIPST|nr:hypothetical protein LIPSTDRAFT_216856 [Lipomyces starkeyi NRRL Y-11557]
MSLTSNVAPIPLFRSGILRRDKRTLELTARYEQLVFQPARKKDLKIPVKISNGRETPISILSRNYFRISLRRYAQFNYVWNGVIEDVFHRWNLMNRRSVELATVSDNDQTSYMVQNSLPVGTLFDPNHNHLKDPSSPKLRDKCTEYFRRLFDQGLVQKSKEMMFWSCESQRWFAEHDARRVWFKEPLQLVVNLKYRADIGKEYTIDLKPLTNFPDKITVTFDRLDLLWSARALQMVVTPKKFGELRPYMGIRVAHPLHRGMELPVIFQCSDSSTFTKLLYPGASKGDYELCYRNRHLGIHLDSSYNSYGYFTFDFNNPLFNDPLFQDLKGFHKFEVAEKTVKYLEKDPTLNLRVSSYEGSVLVCPETGDLLEERECEVWHVNLPRHTYETINSALYPPWIHPRQVRPAKSLIVGYKLYQSVPNNGRPKARLPLWQITENGVPVSEKWYVATHKKDMAQKFGEHEFTRSPCVFSPQFVKVISYLGEGAKPIQYVACSVSELNGEVLPAMALHLLLGQSTELIRNIIVHPEIQPVKKYDGSVNFRSDWRQDLLSFGEDALRTALIECSLHDDSNHASLMKSHIYTCSLRVSMLWRLSQYFNYWIGRNRSGVPTYSIDFSKLRLLPHEQYVLFELQTVIDKVKHHMSGYELKNALNHILHFLENRFYREYYQFLKIEIEQLVIRRAVDFDTATNKFQFWTSDRGLVMTSVFSKILDLVNHLLHPFWPFITEYVHRQLHPGPKVNDMILDFYPRTHIAAARMLSDSTYPLFVTPDTDIRYEDPLMGMPVTSDIGYLSEELKSGVNDAYLIMKGFQWLRHLNRTEVSHGGSVDDSKFRVTSSEQLGNTDMYPDFTYQEDLAAIESQAYGYVSVRNLDNSGRYAELLSRYRTEIARSANLTVLEFYSQASGMHGEDSEATPDIMHYTLKLNDRIDISIAVGNR